MLAFNLSKFVHRSFSKKLLPINISSAGMDHTAILNQHSLKWFSTQQRQQVMRVLKNALDLFHSKKCQRNQPLEKVAAIRVYKNGW